MIVLSHINHEEEIFFNAVPLEGNLLCQALNKAKEKIGHRRFQRKFKSNGKELLEADLLFDNIHGTIVYLWRKRGYERVTVMEFVHTAVVITETILERGSPYLANAEFSKRFSQ